MSIRERRFHKIVNDILKEELQKGNLPSSREFIWRLNQEIGAHDLGGPSSHPMPARSGATIMSEMYNEMLDKIYKDLLILYVGSIDQHNASRQYFNKFETDKGKLDYQIKGMQDRLKELVLLYQKNGFLNSVYDTFADMRWVNQGKTTADVSSGEIKIARVKNVSKKITELPLADFALFDGVKGMASVQSISGTPVDALTDKINQTWQEKIITMQPMEVGGYYNVNFYTLQTMNRITLSLHSIKPVNVKIEFMADEMNWLPLPYYEKGVTIQDEYTFDFPSMSLRKLRISLSKSEPDGQANAQYSYVIGMKNLSFYNMAYAENGAFYSNTWTVDLIKNRAFTIDKVSLSVEEEIPNGTDIRYYIALPPDKNGDEPDWKALSPVERDNPQYDQIIDFKNIAQATPQVLSLPVNINPGEYELNQLQANGIKFYKLGEVQDKTIIEGTEKLFAGKNTWGVKSYNFKFTDHATHLPSLMDWSMPNGTTQFSMYKIQDGKPGVLMDKKPAYKNTSGLVIPTSYMYTLGVFSKGSNTITSATPASTDPIAIYMNGNLLYQGVPDASTKINYLFQKGWNEIIVLVYTGKAVTYNGGEAAGAANGTTLDLGFDVRSYGSNIYSQAKPMTKVKLFDLRYNTLNTDTNKYALMQYDGYLKEVKDEVLTSSNQLQFKARYTGWAKDQVPVLYTLNANKEKVVLTKDKYNVDYESGLVVFFEKQTSDVYASYVYKGSKTFVVVNNAIPGYDYEFYYNYVDGNVKNQILFRADLAKDTEITALSPKLKSYRLRFS